MEFPGFDPARVSRALGLLGAADELVDAYFERLETVELDIGDEGPGVRWHREEGFSLRLERLDGSWMVGVDGLDGPRLSQAYRRVARVMPSTPPVFDGIAFVPADGPPELAEMLAFPERLQAALRERRVAFSCRLSLRRHRRWLQVVGPHLLPAPEAECFYSLDAQIPGGRFGTLLPTLDGAEAQLSRSLSELFRARDAPPPAAGPCSVVLAPAAAAVVLHEVVAHTLEVDNLALTGRPAAAIGVRLGGEHLNLVDDPGGAPPGVRRTTDDEGMPVRRRWLLRAGRVEQPLADRHWAEREDGLQPGAGRRGGRHQPPTPRSTHLELLPGQSPTADLLAGAAGGLFVAEIERGRLDPLAGTFTVEAAWGRRILAEGLGERVGRLRLRGDVASLLDGIVAVGAESRIAGAGWCAKDGQRLPVWATCCGLRVERVEVAPI